jgi:hypothetical protein
MAEIRKARADAKVANKANKAPTEAEIIDLTDDDDDDDDVSFDGPM